MITPHSFEVQAHSSDGYKLQVVLQSIATRGNPKGSIIWLGWKRNGSVCFILSGTEGQFTSTKPPIAWMQSNLSTLGPRLLRQLCIPGSHNSGMSSSSSGTVINHWIITQRCPISSQLKLGVRYLDFQPIISGGYFVSGYYSDLHALRWQGSFILSQWTHK